MCVSVCLCVRAVCVPVRACVRSACVCLHFVCVGCVSLCPCVFVSCQLVRNVVASKAVLLPVQSAPKFGIATLSCGLACTTSTSPRFCSSPRQPNRRDTQDSRDAPFCARDASKDAAWVARASPRSSTTEASWQWCRTCPAGASGLTIRGSVRKMCKFRATNFELFKPRYPHNSPPVLKAMREQTLQANGDRTAADTWFPWPSLRGSCGRWCQALSR